MSDMRSAIADMEEENAYEREGQVPLETRIKELEEASVAMVDAQQRLLSAQNNVEYATKRLDKAIGCYRSKLTFDAVKANRKR